MDSYRDMEDEGVTPQRTNNMWMVTFTDLVSLMLTFFVMLFAMSSVKVDKWETMTDALSQSLNPNNVQTIAAATASFNISTTFQKRAINLDYLAVVLEKTVAGDPILSKSRILRLEDRLVIALPGDLLFPAGQAAMPAAASTALFSLGGVLRNVTNQIVIDGHSDPLPPKKGKFTSNWELSLARAVSVAGALREAGVMEEILPFGYSDSRYGLLEGIPEKARREISRRVDIVILPTVGTGG